MWDEQLNKVYNFSLISVDFNRHMERLQGWWWTRLEYHEVGYEFIDSNRKYGKYIQQQFGIFCSSISCLDGRVLWSHGKLETEMEFNSAIVRKKSLFCVLLHRPEMDFVENCLVNFQIIREFISTSNTITWNLSFHLRSPSIERVVSPLYYKWQCSSGKLDISLPSLR
jgi:hypothetical protein